MTKLAVITGGTGALGSALVAQLLHDGFECHVTWTQPRELEHFVHRQQVSLHQVDCTDETQVRALYTGLSRVDASVHVVGGFAMAPVLETSAAELERMFRLNATSAFVCTREAIGVMRRSQPGRIVNVAARPALAASAGMIAYSTSKSAVAAMTQHIAEEVRAEGILVNAIAPSTMDTPANRASMPSADFSRWPKVEEVARAIAFLVGDNNTLTTGCIVPVFGRA